MSDLTLYDVETALTCQFWKTQPVPQLPTAEVAPKLEEGPIDPPKTPADVKQEPGALPSGFEWCQIDIQNDDQVSPRSQQFPSQRILLFEGYWRSGMVDICSVKRCTFCCRRTMWKMTMRCSDSGIRRSS